MGELLMVECVILNIDLVVGNEKVGVSKGERGGMCGGKYFSNHKTNIFTAETHTRTHTHFSEVIRPV